MAEVRCHIRDLEDQLLSEQTTKSRLAAPQHLLWPEHNLAEKTGPAPGQFPVPFFGRSLPYFHNNDRQKPAPCQPTRPFLATALWEKEGCPLLICANHFETALWFYVRKRNVFGASR